MEGHGPSLSVIIPVLDDAEEVAACLTALSARPPDVEVIVVDGGSLDGTPILVEGFGFPRLLRSDPGRARQMNAGAAGAGGAVFLFLHADTRLPPDAFAALAEALADPAVVGGRFDVRLASDRPIFRLVEALMNLRSRWTGIATGDQAIFARREAFEAIGGYPDIPLMEDVELSKALKRVGRLACLRARVRTSARKWERDGVLRTILLMWTLRSLHFIGVDPHRLHRLYYPQVRAAGQTSSPRCGPAD